MSGLEGNDEALIREMLEAGVHFGHQTKRWNPRMRPYIYGSRGGIYIIDLLKTAQRLRGAIGFAHRTVAAGGSVLFVGTKPQAQDIVRAEAERTGMFYVTYRWLGGTLTNFTTIRKNVDRLKEIERMEAERVFDKLPKKEVMTLRREQTKITRALGGLKEMKRLPSLVVVVDVKRERIAVAEAQRLGIPIVALVDTNCDPRGIHHVVPGNDDALRSITYFVTRIGAAVYEGLQEREARLKADEPKGEGTLPPPEGTPAPAQGTEPSGSRPAPPAAGEVAG